MKLYDFDKNFDGSLFLLSKILLKEYFIDILIFYITLKILVKVMHYWFQVRIQAKIQQLNYLYETFVFYNS